MSEGFPEGGVSIPDAKEIEGKPDVRPELVSSFESAQRRMIAAQRRGRHGEKSVEGPRQLRRGRAPGGRHPVARRRDGLAEAHQHRPSPRVSEVMDEVRLHRAAPEHRAARGAEKGQEMRHRTKASLR